MTAPASTLRRIYRRLYWLPSDLRAWRRFRHRQRLLIIGDALGDNVLLSAVAWEFHTRGEHNTVVSTPHPELFSRHPGVAEVVPLDWNLMTTLPRIGCQTHAPFYADASPLPDREIPPPRHIIAEMCRRSGIRGRVKLRPYLFLSDDERAASRWAEGALVLQSSGLSGRLKMLNKEWRSEGFPAVAKYFHGRLPLVQIGSPGDPSIEGARDLRGHTSTRETAAVLANAAAFVGLVGFPMHLARAVDCPSVIVYGGRERPDQSGYSANENLYTPVECSPCWRWQTCEHDRVCLTSITNEMVIAAIERLLRRPRSPLAIDDAVI